MKSHLIDIHIKINKYIYIYIIKLNYIPYKNYINMLI